MILTDEEIREIDTSEYWFEHTPHEFAREIEAAVLVKLLASKQEPVAQRKPLFADMIASHPGLKEELLAQYRAVDGQLASGQELLGYLVKQDDLDQLSDLADRLMGGSDRERDIGHCVWLILNRAGDLPIHEGDPAPAQHSTDASRTARIDTMMRERRDGIKEQP